MKIIRSSISNDLTPHLAALAESFEGKKVVYIAPNSLSFEKELRVLQSLRKQATFDILVSRFSQLGHYYKGLEKPQAPINELGLTLVFYKVLNQLSQENLGLYSKSKKDPGFIKKLIQIYREFQKGNIDLISLASATDMAQDLTQLSLKKIGVLTQIFSAVTAELSQKNLTVTEDFSHFIQAVAAGDLDDKLAQQVFIFDGFTRFSAQERELVNLLEAKSHAVILSVYLSEQALSREETLGSVYEAPKRFLASFPEASVESVGKASDTVFARVSELFEREHLFTTEEKPLHLTQAELAAFQIWQPINQQVELKTVARQIRQLVEKDGVSYKDISIFVGDMASYEHSLPTIFEQFGIPCYLSQQERMAHHPLVVMVEALYRLLAFDFLAEDLIQLLRTDLFGKFPEADLLYFNQYLRYVDLKGWTSLCRPIPHLTEKKMAEFKGKDHLSTTEKALISKERRYHLRQVEKIRKQVVKLLKPLETREVLPAQQVLLRLLEVLKSAHFETNFVRLAVKDGQGQQDELVEAAKLRHEEVGKAFNDILSQFAMVFEDSDLDLIDSLALIHAGMQAANYRIIPATVDVVKVRKYDLVEPHANRYVFALGMVEGQFPMEVVNQSLLSEEERLAISQGLSDHQYLETTALDAEQNNLYTALSLFNAAHEQLVISCPELINESQASLSSYVSLLTQKIPELAIQKLGEPNQSWQSRVAAGILGYQDALAFLIDQKSQKTANFEEVSLSAVLHRLFRKHLAEVHAAVPTLTQSTELVTSQLTEEVLLALFPEDRTVQLSASAVRNYYNNPYLYFVNHIINLQEEEHLRPNPAQNGSFLHRVMEKQVESQADVASIIAEVLAEPEFVALYDQDEESKFTLELLKEIAQVDTAVLRGLLAESVEPQVHLLEKQFILKAGQVGQGKLRRSLEIKGVIDRVDKLNLAGQERYAVVDYKSSENKFHLQDFVFGLKNNQQLITYVAALTSGLEIVDEQPRRILPDVAETSQVFGAMFSYLGNPTVALKSAKASIYSDLPKAVKKILSYKGIFLEDIYDELSTDFYGTERNQVQASFSKEDLDLLVAYNSYLFEQAAEQILQGKFPVLPYTQDEKTVAGNQLRGITQFEADRHLGLIIDSPRNLHRRKVKSSSRSETKQILLDEIRQQLHEDEEEGGQV